MRRLDPHNNSYEHRAALAEAARGNWTRVSLLTGRSIAVLAALVIAAVCLAGPPEPVTARRVALGAPGGRARALAFGPGGRVLAATVLDGSIHRWWVDPRTESARSLGPALPGMVAAFSPDGALLAAGDISTVTLCDVTSDEPRQTFQTSGGGTRALAFSRDGRLLAAASEQDVIVWQIGADHEQVARFRTPGVFSLAFTPDGLAVAAGEKLGAIRLWDLSTGRQRLAIQAHDREITSLVFSNDGRVLVSASASGEKMARLWDVATGREFATLRGHSAPAHSLAFAPGKAIVATAGLNGTVRLWDVRTGQEKAAQEGLGAGALVLAFSPDGRTIATAGMDQEVWLLDVDEMLGRPSTEVVQP
jgi:dipeptidyl aminopeptidase/acylaminoacyl peptidase